MTQTKTKYEKTIICDSCKAKNYVYTFSNGMSTDELYTCWKCKSDFFGDNVKDYKESTK